MDIVIVKYPHKINKLSKFDKFIMSIPFVAFAIMMLITLWDAVLK